MNGSCLNCKQDENQITTQTMEEQIKALIEKYEGKAGSVPDQIITAGSDYMKGYADGVKFGTNCLLDDLKQLLTTSQGNPDMV